MRKSLPLLLLLLIYFSHASTQNWKAYPHHQPGSVLTFPDDEGWHPGVDVEWWYTNAKVTGDSTGTDYSFMLTYFYYDTLTFDGFRIFNLANDNTGEFYPETQPCKYPNIQQSHCEIPATVGLLTTHHEEWVTVKDSSGNLIPFQYHLQASSPNGAIDMFYNAVKRPLMVGGTGYLLEGEHDWTYYYSLTLVEVTGTITFKGVTETVSGTAWVDRQWGAFNPNTGPKYEWFSIQLSNGMDMNLWNIFTADDRVPDTSTYRFCSIYINDSTDTTISDFDLTRLEYQFTPDQSRCYSKKWNLSFGNTSLDMTVNYPNSEVQLPFRFIEGITDITGTVNGVPVTGTGFAELLHYYKHPQISITAPLAGTTWDGISPFSWNLLNPDDARPIYYDVDISTDNKVNFTNLASAITGNTFSWTSNLSPGTQAWLRIKGYSIDSTLTGMAESNAPFTIGITGIKPLTQEIQFHVAPNPFRSLTTISYDLAQTDHISIEVFDIQGKLVDEIFEGTQTPGSHEFQWPNPSAGEGVFSGIYYCRLQSGQFSKTIKLSYIK